MTSESFTDGLEHPRLCWYFENQYHSGRVAISNIYGLVENDYHEQRIISSVNYYVPADRAPLIFSQYVDTYPRYAWDEDEEYDGTEDWLDANNSNGVVAGRASP